MIFEEKHQGGWGCNWFFTGPLREEKRGLWPWKTTVIAGTVSGHLTPLPQKGDVFYSPMKSGKTGIFVALGVDYPGNPPDMFFANVEMRGYL